LLSRDANNGICKNILVTNGAVSGYQVARTTNGGTSWQAITPSLADTASTLPIGRRGKFYFDGLDASQGYFISYGRWRVSGQGANRLPQNGYSVSLDGITWRDVQTSYQIISMDVQDSNGHGYAGAFTEAMLGGGGIYKTATTLPDGTPNTGGALSRNPLSNRNAELQLGLSVYPNPSNGTFTLKLNDGFKAGTQVTVFDAMGRSVYSRELNGTAVNAQSATIDMGRQTPGVYTLELRTSKGNAQQKLVIE
jgi:hypothetical protein